MRSIVAATLTLVALAAPALAVPVVPTPARGLSQEPAASTSHRDSHTVRGYWRKDGTYVAPHRQSNPDETAANNWSTKGNRNPFNSKEGSVAPAKKKTPKAEKTKTAKTPPAKKPTAKTTKTLTAKKPKK